MALRRPVIQAASTLMPTDRRTQTDDRIDAPDADGGQPVTGSANGASTTLITAADRVPVTALLAEDRTAPFVGLTDAAATRVREIQPVSPELQCGGDEPVSLEEAISALPPADSGELWTTSELVATEGTVDAVRLGRDIGTPSADALRFARTAVEPRRDEPPVVTVTGDQSSAVEAVKPDSGGRMPPSAR